MNNADRFLPQYHDTFIREVRVSYLPTNNKRFAIRQPGDVAIFVRGILPENSREHFVALYLDGAHQVVGYSIISIGTATATLVHPREIFQRAILVGAVSIAVSHNHPSGQTAPSSDDLVVTRMIRDAAKILQLNLLDHVIVTDLDCCSIRGLQSWYMCV